VLKVEGGEMENREGKMPRKRKKSSAYGMYDCDKAEVYYPTNFHRLHRT